MNEPARCVAINWLKSFTDPLLLNETVAFKYNPTLYVCVSIVCVCVKSIAVLGLYDDGVSLYFKTFRLLVNDVMRQQQSVYDWLISVRALVAVRCRWWLD